MGAAAAIGAAGTAFSIYSTISGMSAQRSAQNRADFFNKRSLEYEALGIEETAQLQWQAINAEARGILGEAAIAQENAKAELTFGASAKAINYADADQVLKKNEFDQASLLRENQRLLSTQRTEYAAGGVRVGSGTAIAVADDTVFEYELDAWMMNETAAAQANRFRSTGDLEFTQAAQRSRIFTMTSQAAKDRAAEMRALAESQLASSKKQIEFINESIGAYS